jgi:putative CocE/NonD family hydrolase
MTRSGRHVDVVHERDVPVAMPDGVELLTDVWRPRRRQDVPTIMVRSPYGRRGAMGFLYGRLFAHRGFRVLVQSCRGTYGSGGELSFAHEAGDAQATVQWLRLQPWFTGQLATAGASYLGFVQWALTAEEPPPELKAMVVQIAPTAAREFAYSGGAMSYENCLTWAQLMTAPGTPIERLRRARERARALRAAAQTLPLAESYVPATGGHRAQYFEEWIGHDPDDPWWSRFDYSSALDRIGVPVLLQGAWHDIYAAETVQQYATLRRRGIDARLSMYGATHIGLVAAWRRVFPEAADWLHDVFAGSAAADGARVRTRVLGTKTWRKFADWPPAATPHRLHLHPGGGLAGDPPPESGPDRYRYDPADPTPSVGGGTLARNAGPQDNRRLEARADVLTYTGRPLDRPLDVIGPVSADLWFGSSLDHTDVFVRLCRVTPDGKSTNVCDAIRRLDSGPPEKDAAGVRRVQLELSPTACRFEPGERIRVQVSSGAHPRFVRNTGSGEPLATALRLVAADQAVYHDPDRPSSVVLSVVG